LPNITLGTAVVAATTSNNGFILSITGWDKADCFEIAYTTRESGATFDESTSTDMTRAIFGSKRIEFVTTSSAIYSIAVRPLIAGQQVATPYTGTVLTGSKGIPSEAVRLIDTDIDFNPIHILNAIKICDNADQDQTDGEYFDVFFPLTLDYMSYNNPNLTRVGDIVDFYNSDNLSGQLGNSNAQYKVIMNKGLNVITLGGTPTTGYLLQVVYINGSKRTGNSLTVFDRVDIDCFSKKSRQITSKPNLFSNYKIIRIDFDCEVIKDVLNGAGGLGATPAKTRIRIYGHDKENDYQYIDIALTASDQPITTNASLTLFRNSNLVADCYNPVTGYTSENRIAVKGRLIVWGILDNSII
jgi:hypothetical protein